MHRRATSVVGAVLVALTVATPSAAQVRYSTGAVGKYMASCGGSDLPLAVPESNRVQFWYDGAGFARVTTWEDGNVWGSDFRDGFRANDTDPSGGSDLPDVYVFAGHGNCQNPPQPGSGDYVIVCGNFGKPDVTRIGTSSRWGNSPGRLKFMLLDASCPMDLPEVPTEWFSPFRGLHVATGNSGSVDHDVYDSVDRGGEFAAYSTGAQFQALGIQLSLLPTLSVGDAWMTTGLIDVQDGNCAVALAAGENRDDAINRRDNEFLTSNWPDPTPNWFAWRWICID